ncbi:MAG: hypothetical protein OMM_12359, partial [Candidatus Magnetoglobus multicellularis str. Araruama]
DITFVSAGGYHSLALKVDGSVWAWGENYSGQLGDGTTSSSSTPAQIGSLSNIILIAAGFNYSIALKNDGTVWVWGDNRYGQLGGGITPNITSPVKIADFTNVVSIGIAGGHTLAVKDDGTAWAWGDNYYGQIGNGMKDHKSTPEKVISRIQTTNEDTPLTVTYSITDAESAPCDLTITLISSDSSLIHENNLNYSCQEDSYDIHITPTENQSGTADITIIASDFQGLTASQSFSITVTAVDDPIQLSNVANMNMSEDTSHIITFNASDPDLSPCSLGITITSSNPDLITDSGLTVVCDNDMYTLTADPINNAFGSSIITILVSDGTSIEESQFTITVDNTPDPISLSLQNGDTTIDINNATIDKLSVSQMDFVPITVCVQTSDSNLVAINNISLTGAGLTGSTGCYNLSLPTLVEDYTSTITPETNASGVCSITFTATSEFGITAITAFDLTITGGIPSISSMFTQTTLENLSTSMVFSITDTAGGMMSLTSYASDSLLVSADNIHLTHALITQSSDSYTINVTAGIPETITLTIIPAENQFGDTQINILVTNPYGLTALTSFSLSVVESGARSMAFDGIDDHIISDADIAIPPTNAISIEAWIYL